MTEPDPGTVETDFPKTGAPAQRALIAAGYTHLAQLTSVSEKELALCTGWDRRP